MNPLKLLTPSLRRSRAALSALCATALASLSPLQAFPPAPFFTLYGEARDPFGNLLPPEGATISLYHGGKEIQRQSLLEPGQNDYNYQLRLRIDQMRLGTSTYSSLSLNPGDAFTIAIEVGGLLLYPIELANTLQVGDPAERQRLDLTLGVDTDGDGLPDTWEQAQLFQAGYLPGNDGWDLSLIDRDSDLDQNGVTNWIEYIANTYANDHEPALALQVKEILPDAVRLEFYAIYNGLYWLQASTDLAEWQTVPFSLASDEPDAPARTILRSGTTGIVSIYSTSQGPNAFYRLRAK